MKYEKPEVRFLGSAVSTIQNPLVKGSGGSQDNLPGQPVTYKSLMAYAADE